MDGSVPDLRLQIAGLLDGMIDLDQFQEWFARFQTDIELRGGEADLDLLGRVMLFLAEYTGDHISQSELLNALRSEVLAVSAHK